jgi:hypothetical protein
MMKKITKKEINLLLVVLGIGLLVVSYMFVYSGYNERAESLHSEINRLRPELNDLQAKEAERGRYEAGIINARETLLTKQEEYDVQVLPEDWIMYIVELMKEYTLWSVDNLAMSVPQSLTTLYTLERGEEEGQYITTEKEAMITTAEISCLLSYEQLKRFVTYVYNSSNKTSLTSLSVTFDSQTRQLRGIASLSKCFLTVPGSKAINQWEEELAFINPGARNPFGTDVDVWSSLFDAFNRP